MRFLQCCLIPESARVPLELKALPGEGGGKLSGNPGETKGNGDKLKENMFWDSRNLSKSGRATF